VGSLSYPEATPRSVQVKRAALSLITRTVAVPYWHLLVRDVAIVFMLHRFADSERGVEGITREELRASLAFLRRHRFRLGSFNDLLSEPYANSGRPIVLFTVDDGHEEFATVAAPVFAEYDCPVTVFLTTGPIDGAMWFWWDKVDFVVKTTSRREVRLDIDGKSTMWHWRLPRERRLAASEIVEQLKLIPEDAKRDLLATLAERLEVTLPSTPPPAYTAMSWTDVRRCAARGATFGPHTVTHPILSQISEPQAEWEILESWRRLRAECDATVPIFCYPNGLYSSREVNILRRSDLVAAVTTKPQYTSRSVSLANASSGRFHLPRFNYPADHAEFVAIATGLDRVNSFMRQGRDGWSAVGMSDEAALR
jgi:peptidoglycan/xylan/chitin deacetylase (PgdA/CDA1 family)